MQKVLCGYCKYIGDRQSFHRHLINDHGFQRPLNAMDYCHTESNIEDIEYDIESTAISEKNGELIV